MSKMGSGEVVVRGAGVIGLALALELRRRGASVTVVDAGAGAGMASTAAAGMLAVEDPHHPEALRALARFSGGMYAEFLHRVEAMSGLAVPFQTETTVQYAADGTSVQMAERSVDPRMLMEALGAAVAAAGIAVVEGVERSEAVVVQATGAWFGGRAVRPVKGQMLRVRMPEGVALREVHRSEQVYVVPRTAGPQAGTALIGATVEDVGFDVATSAEDLERLREMAAKMVPWAGEAVAVEAWAGLRPGTVDGLPVMGAAGERAFVATGHLRNGILLAPGTAAVMADLIEGKETGVGLEAFAVGRFGG